MSPTTITFDRLQVPVQDAVVFNHVERTDFENMVARHLQPRFHAEMLRRGCHTYGRSAFGVLSPLLRVELASYGPDISRLLEAELDSSGLGIMELLGISVSSLVAHELREQGVEEIGYFRSACRAREAPDQDPAIAAFEGQGLRVHDACGSVERLPSGCPVWIHAGHGSLVGSGNPAVTSMMERSIFWPSEEGGSKRYLLGINARMLSDFKTLDEVEREFPHGFVVKPLVGRNGAGVSFFYPEPRTDMDEAWYRSRAGLSDVIGSPNEASMYLVQPLFDQPTIGEGSRTRYETMALFFVFIQERYRLRGGYFMNTPSPKVHLGKRTQFRPIRC